MGDVDNGGTPPIKPSPVPTAVGVMAVPDHRLVGHLTIDQARAFHALLEMTESVE